jgi:hypothetical protein
MDSYWKSMDQDENETTMIPRPGVYKHYKGEYYLVLTTAQHTERDEILVLYVPLTGNENRAGLRVRARPLEGEKGFNTLEEGMYRFVYVGQEMPNAKGEIIG